ncbi:MAG: alpha-L-fucosidase [Oscillospiraceae bacterium]|nr:alpha-L-fucosidase [Oscillospiraceae bacterium]
MKKRSEGFFGLHFDFHAGEDCTEIGKNVTEKMIREVIEMLRPDFIQCDCKGHRGFSSYQTKIGNPAPGFVHDQLKIWRKITKEYGVPLVMHYSGIWDNRALETHPEWAVINENGSPDKEKTSTFKAYADELLIPQLLELANVYGVDGVWVDGECWAVKPDFDEKIITLFEKEYGVKLIKDIEGKYDKNSDEYRKFLHFNRKQFLKYIGHYTDKVHKNAPDFEIASNWAFSSHMPEKVCLNVDFLSGDFNPDDSYNSARFEARVLCEQNKPWDLMAWGFNRNFTGDAIKSVKSPETLCREAASVISLGGGFQIYNNQNRDGSVNLWEVREMKPVAEFVRKREPFLKGGKPFSNIGILYSDYDRKNRIDKVGELFPYGWNERVKGAVRMVLDSAHSCSILMDHMLEPENNSFSEKNIVIVPELKYINEEIKNKLLKFAETGGNLIISGYDGCKLFADALEGVKIADERRETVIQIVNGTRNIHQKAVFGEVKIDENAGNTEILRKCSAGSPVIAKTKYGKGSIVAVYYNMFDIYYDATNFYVRNMMSEIIGSLGGEKFISYKGQKFVDIVPAKKDGKLLISLINTIEIYSEKRLRAYDEIPDLTNIEIIVKLAKEPASIRLQPENVIPEYKYDASAGKLTVNINKLHIHSIIVIE